jgi:hypothetical protein
MMSVMKSLSMCALSALALAITGCISERDHLVLDAVGPVHASATPKSNEGFLTVYSAYDAGAHFYSPRFDRREFSDYSIFDTNGQLLRKVHNSTDTIIEEPPTISLSPGQYKVIARANGYGDVTVPVTIERDQQTVLHLEGGGTAPELAGADPSKTVRLPDGCIVGYRSNP